MMQILLVGIGAGAAAALLFASVATGSFLATLLFYLASLPILIAALGWNHLAGLLGALVAAAGLWLAFGFYFFLVFLFGIGLPAWWLGYLALLGRPAGANGAGTMEWFPVGRLVFWAATLSALFVAATLLALGSDLATFLSELRSSLTRILAVWTKSTPEMLERPEVRRSIDAAVRAVPAGLAVLLMILYTFNLWLAARIANVSGRLRRPWPDLPEMTLPTFTLGALAVAIVGSFLPDLPGMLARVLAATLFMAYAMMGFAVLHAITRGMNGRGFLLTGTYLAVFILTWLPIVAMAMLGIAETTFNIRARFATPAAGPPTTRT